MFFDSYVREDFDVSEDLNREILKELKEINNKLDTLNSSKGITRSIERKDG